MGALIGIAAIIIYYLIVSNLIDAGSAPTGLVATAYIFIPLIGIPLIVGSARASAKARGKGHVSVIVSTAGAVVAGVVVVLLANNFLKPAAPDPVADEKTRQAVWIARGQDAVKAKLKDPGSAQFRGIYFHRGQDGVPITCGEVNSKNSFGGYSGFQRFISAGSAELTYLQEQMDAREFVTVWNRFCAK
ncbi:hypothetical protein [Pseudoxanthomonas suwonensis]|uniref:hypothetical protein n=1 Tax=Pseudoxanthomonas suwonensis TaxID=314722 RepID=UPI0012DC5C63|nr:hypothetical protein [Pseudoxanthomonas suwonensis]